MHVLLPNNSQQAVNYMVCLSSNFRSNFYVINAILDMYGKCGDIMRAEVVLNEMCRRDILSWNPIVAAYEQNGLTKETICLFSYMLACGIEPDEFTYGML